MCENSLCYLRRNPKFLYTNSPMTCNVYDTNPSFFCACQSNSILSVICFYALLLGFVLQDIPKLTVCSAMWATTRYHMGTLAFGSLIIATVSFIRTIIEYIEQKLKQYDNEVTKALRCCCRCFCWCLENFLRFINRNAYIMTAIYGENFCASARRSFLLLMRNVVRVVVVDKVSNRQSRHG